MVSGAPLPPETVVEGETGHVVDGRDVAAVTDAIVGVLRDRDRAAAMGAAGRTWVQEHWRWDVLATRLRQLLQEP